VPRHDAAEIALERLGESGRRLRTAARRIVAMSAERFEIEFVQDHGSGSSQLFALEAIDLEGRRVRQIERRETRSNGVQPLYRAAVVVDVMAHEQSL
jgi:hypothetical protein